MSLRVLETNPFAIYPWNPKKDFPERYFMIYEKISGCVFFSDKENILVIHKRELRLAKMSEIILSHSLNGCRPTRGHLEWYRRRKSWVCYACGERWFGNKN